MAARLKLPTSEKNSLAESLALLPDSERRKLLAKLTQAEAEALLYDWRFWARPKQLAPPGDWDTWVIRAGRGFGKTRAGAGWVHERAMEYPGRWIALIARTPADARDYMIEGPGGILKNTHPRERPIYEPSKRRLTWPNGSWATVYSAEEPDQLRGFSGDTAWLDEFAKWPNPEEVWTNLQFGMREASTDKPRRLITSTPRPLEILRKIEESPRTVVVVGSSYENKANLDPSWFEAILAQYEGTNIGRQEIYAEFIAEVPGALWTRAMIERNRVIKPPEFRRIVVAVDPEATSGEKSAETGIIVAALGVDGHGYVLEDVTKRGRPHEWASAAISAYWKWEADRLIAEVNNGGDMVEHVIRSVDPKVAYKAVRASHGKQTRAEPIAALYEQGRVHHVGIFPDLEDQLCTWVPGKDKKSPDRLDAAVWALTELMLGTRTVTVRTKPAGF